MKPSTIYIISTLSALASAVNLVGYSQSGCGSGAYVSCSNIPPNTCCVTVRGTQGAVAGLFQNIPGSANIYGWQRTRDGKNCGSAIAAHHVGAGSFCDNLDTASGQFAGLSWSTASKKRSAASKCTSSVEPDLLVLGDGRKFDLTTMDEEKIDEVWALAFHKPTIDSLQTLS